MVSMLVPLLLASASTGPSALEAVAPNQGVEVWLDTRAAYERGEFARVHARANDDGYLLVLHADAAGRVRVLFPIDPYIDDFVRGGETLEIRGRGDRDAFLVDERSGAGLVLAAWSPDPFRFDDFVLDDHWDYRVMSPLRGVDAEADLLDLARRMALAQFDYDVAEYIVGNTAPYRRSPVHVTTSWYDPWCVGCVRWGPAARSGFYLNVGFGTYGTHAAFGYGPRYRVRPILYRPVWYSPVWYRPAYHVPYYARAYRGRYHPVWGYYHPRRGPRWRHARHYHWPYYDRSGFGIHVQYAGSSFGADLFFRSDDRYYARSRTGILSGVFDRPFDGSGRRVQVRKAVPRNDAAPRAGIRRAMARNGVGRANDASTRTPPRATRVRIAQERNAKERSATTRRGSNSGNTRAARPRLIRDDVSSARVGAASPRPATPRARSETQSRAKASAQPSSARTAQPRSNATRPASSSRAQRTARPRQSEARPATSSQARRPANSQPSKARRVAPSQVQRKASPAQSARSQPAAARRPAASSRARPSARPAASGQSRPSSIRPSRSAPKPAAASRSGSTARTRAAETSRRAGSAKARSTSSSKAKSSSSKARSSSSAGKRGGGKKKR